ncbi:MAG: thiamine-phosphate kinase [Gemmatimonadales bacterium]|nr:MAG: thiamine-phosphate kinase [Gemmatimonadales bacterium]
MSTGREDPKIVRFGVGGEFRRIRSFLESLPAAPGVRVGPGDDAAVLDGGIVLSTDMAVEGVHFRLDWVTPGEVGYRACAAALSDLAGMAARPLGVLVSLAVPDPGGQSSLPIMSGVRELLDRLKVPLLGGDLTRSPGPVVLDVVVVGQADHPLLRRGARPGDELWVTGRLGAAAAAVGLWERGIEPPPGLREPFVRPTPRLAEARYLVSALGATSGMDLSDGLAGDGSHLAAASDVDLVLDTWRIPLHPEATSKGPEIALHGGEDFELLVTLPPDPPKAEVENFRKRFDLSLTRIGSVGPGLGLRIRDTPKEEPRTPERGGWDHFNAAEEEEQG